jgi:flagellar basal body-associated protein FliL
MPPKDTKSKTAPKSEKADAAAADVKKSKKPFVLWGAVAAILALSWVLATLAVPSRPVYRTFEGPFMAALSAERVQANLAGEHNKRFLVMSLNAMFDAYAQDYVAKRTADPLYHPLLIDAILGVTSGKTREQVHGPVAQETFREELRRAIEPILFPIHVGDAPTPHAADPKSGVKPGLSAFRGTMRDPLFDRMLYLDVPMGRARLGEGPEIAFSAGERDLRVTDDRGLDAYIDLSEVKPDFRGQVKIGVHGRIRQILFQEYLVQ